MTTTTAVLAVIAALGIAIVLIAVMFLRYYLQYRGKRVVICPETRQPVGVEIDAPLASRTALLDDPRFVIASCTRWPEKSDCVQGCLAQIEASPEETLMRSILTRWYRGKQCVYCGREIGPIRWHDAVPSLRGPAGELREWSGIAPQDLPSVLYDASPVCWNCNLAEVFRREYPGLVTDRRETPLRNRAIH